MAEVDDFERLPYSLKEVPQAFPIAGTHPFVGNNHPHATVDTQITNLLLLEVDVEIIRAIEGLAGLFQVGLERFDDFLTHIGWVANDDIKSRRTFLDLVLVLDLALIGVDEAKEHLG